MNLPVALGIIGSLAGLLAGLAGTYLAIASSDGPRERSFMVRGAWVCWGAVALVVASRLLLPTLWPLLAIVGALILRPAIGWWSDRQVEIRQAERAHRAHRVRTAGVGGRPHR